jgi:FlaA1/EpsC-like NDP-sugar epimerase
MSRNFFGIHAPMMFRWREYLMDAGVWAVALPIASLVRVDFDPTRVAPVVVGLAILLAAALQAVFGWILGLYRYRHPYGSRHDAHSLMMVVSSVGVIIAIGRLLVPPSDGFPRSVPFIGLLVAFVLMAGVRLLHRSLRERDNRPGETAAPALVYGAGHLGQHVIQQMIRDRFSPFRPVGVIDDDPRLQEFRVEGVRVLGGRADLIRAAQETGAEILIFAIARADAELLRNASDEADSAGLRLLVLPLLADVLEGHAQLGDLRDVSIDDIIGRRPVDTEMDSIAHYVTGKRILVTGAGGSIGSELCRQLWRFSPSEVLMLDRDESGLHGTQMSVFGHGLLDTSDVILADIRDKETLTHILAKRLPDVVFHAAALKHLPMLEQYPEEAWKTNVLGTLNVLEASREAGVPTLVNISTDKAADPTSFLGKSKRIAEQLTAWMARDTGLNYLSVRFGNVIGSRGSMLPTFLAQIEAGGPVTVTDPEVTRYFMTIPEACQLVVQAAAIGRPGEVLILDMGQPIRILDVAERMIAMSGKQIDITFTGLRSGEKLHEALIDVGETDERPFHPSISHSSIPGLHPDDLAKSRGIFSAEAAQGLPT